MDREKRRLELVGIRETSAIGLRARAAALRAFRTGNNPASAAAIVLREAIPVLAQGMHAAHIKGSIRAATAGAKAMKRRLRMGNAYDEALRLLEEKARAMGIDTSGFGTLFETAAMRSITDAQALLAQKLSVASAEIVSTGVHRQGGMEIIRAAFDSAGITVRNPYQLETIYRMEVGSAYAAGRLAVIKDSPTLQGMLWGWQYVTVGDDRVRESHAALDGVRKPKDDPFWRKYTPPWAYGCRCGTLEIYTDEAEFASDTGPVDVPPADEGFAVSPAWALAGV